MRSSQSGEKPSWQDIAICSGMETNWFYDDYESDSIFASVMDSICFSCPVRNLCLKEGVENKESGLWGGVFLIGGKPDENRNAHKSDATWKIIRNEILNG